MRDTDSSDPLLIVDEVRDAELSNPLLAAHLYSNGDLLLVRKRDMALHQDLLGLGRRRIELHRGTDAFISVDILSLQQGQRFEVVSLTAKGELHATTVDSDGHSTHSEGQVHLSRGDDATDGQPPLATCIVHTKGLTLVGTSDENVHTLRHVAGASDSSVSGSGLRTADFQVHRLREAQFGFMGLLQSGKRFLGILGPGGSSAEKGTPFEELGFVRHGGRPAVQWYGFEAKTCPVLRLLPMSGTGRVLSIGADAIIWSGVGGGDSGREILEHRFPLFRAACSAALGMEDYAEAEGIAEASSKVCLVDAALLPAEAGVSTLMVLAVSNSDPNENSRVGCLWLLTLKVGASGFEYKSRQKLADDALLANYYPTLHADSASAADRGFEHPASKTIMVSWVSSTTHTLKVSTLEAASPQLSSAGFSRQPIPEVTHDSGIHGESLVTCAFVTALDGLLALLENGNVSLVPTGPRAVSPRVDRRLEAPQSPVNPGQDARASARRKVASIFTGPASDHSRKLRAIVSMLSDEDAAEVISGASMDLVNSAPSGLHWGSSASDGSSAYQYQVALQSIDEKVKRHASLIAAIDQLLPRSALQARLVAVHQNVLAAQRLCAALWAAAQAPQRGKLTDECALRAQTCLDAGMEAEIAGNPLAHAGLQNFAARGLSVADAYFANLSASGENLKSLVRRTLSVVKNTLAQAGGKASGKDVAIEAAKTALGILSVVNGSCSADATITDPSTSDSAFKFSAAAQDCLYWSLHAFMHVSETAQQATPSSDVPWWRSEGPQGALVLSLASACDSLLTSCAHSCRLSDASRDQAADLVGRVMLKFTDARQAFQMAAKHGHFVGLLNAYERDPSLSERLVAYIREGAAVDLVDFVLKRYVVASECRVEPRRLKLLFEIGQLKVPGISDRWASFLRSQPNFFLSWHESLRNCDYSRAALAAMTHAKQQQQTNKESARTLASIAKLAAVMDLRTSSIREDLGQYDAFLDELKR